MPVNLPFFLIPSNLVKKIFLKFLTKKKIIQFTNRKKQFVKWDFGFVNQEKQPHCFFVFIFQ